MFPFPNYKEHKNESNLTYLTINRVIVKDNSTNFGFYVFQFSLPPTKFPLTISMIYHNGTYKVPYILWYPDRVYINYNMLNKCFVITKLLEEDAAHKYDSICVQDMKFNSEWMLGIEVFIYEEGGLT